MRKSLVLTLTMVFILAIASSAFAAATFVDVPAKHWSYDAVKKLAQSGLVDGYGDGTFKGDKTITRYEMAMIVAKAMDKSDKADIANKALIEKLAAEFKAELGNLGVRVASLEKNAPSIKITGDARVRFQSNDELAGYTQAATALTPARDVAKEHRFNVRARLFLKSDINDKMAFEGTVLAQNTLSDNNNTRKSSNDEFEFARVNVTFKDVMPLSNLTVGRTNVKLSQGMILGGDYFDGVKLTFGNKLKGFYAYGDYRYMPGPKINAAAENTGAKAAEVLALSYNTSKNVNLTAGYVNSKTAGLALEHKTADFGFTAVINNDWKVMGEYAKNSYSAYSALQSADKTAYMATLQYGDAKKTVPGSFDVWVRYAKLGKYVVDRGNADAIAFDCGGNYYGNDNMKGMNYGIDYTLGKNAILSLEYDKWKGFSTTSTANAKDYKPFYSVTTCFWF